MTVSHKPYEHITQLSRIEPTWSQLASTRLGAMQAKSSLRMDRLS